MPLVCTCVGLPDGYYLVLFIGNVNIRYLGTQTPPVSVRCVVYRACVVRKFIKRGTDY